MRAILSISVAVLLPFITFGQSIDKLPAFDAADINLSVPTAFAGMSGGLIRNGLFELRNATMVDLIRTAYAVEPEKVLGGPSWLESTRFNVLASAPANTTQETARAMLKTLLAERFALKVHDDNKPLSVFVLSLGKDKPKLKLSRGGQPGCRPQPQSAPTPGAIPYIQVTCTNLTADQIVVNLRQMPGSDFDKPIINSIMLDGGFDFDFKWTPRAQLAAAGADGISMFDAVEKQLGLKVDLQRVATPVIVVDAVNEKPAESAAGIGKRLTAEKPEFEVAEIKPADPSGPQGSGIRYTQGGRIDAIGTLRQLITLALEIRPNVANDLLVAEPNYLDGKRFHILAQAPRTGLGAASREGGREIAPPISIALTMLRGLLEERFKLKTHTEERPATVYAVLLPKGELKLKKADPATRASCRPDPGAIPVRPGGGPMQAWTCQNTTVADLAKNLPQWAPGFIDHPVLDKTGLQTGWDFTLIWMQRPALEAPPNRLSEATGPAALDPTGGLSVFDALEKQLGLKLEKQTHTIPVTVIDHVEQNPTD